MSALGDLLTSGYFKAWVDASNPEDALRTWPRVTLQANNISGRYDVPNRRGRAAAINALKHAIETFPWTDSGGRAFDVRLVLESKHYSEGHGFMHASYFTYRIEGDLHRA